MKLRLPRIVLTPFGFSIDRVFTEDLGLPNITGVGHT